MYQHCNAAGRGIFGRNLDLECSFGEEVAVMPRRFPLTFRRQEPLPWHLAMVGMAHVAEGGAPLCRSGE